MLGRTARGSHFVVTDERENVQYHLPQAFVTPREKTTKGERSMKKVTL